MNCHESEKLNKLSKDNIKVKITLFDNRVFEGWIDIPDFGYGYIISNPENPYDLRVCKSHIKKIEIVPDYRDGWRLKGGATNGND